jgi:hypothetical protein
MRSHAGAPVLHLRQPAIANLSPQKSNPAPTTRTKMNPLGPILSGINPFAIK